MRLKGAARRIFLMQKTKPVRQLNILGTRGVPAAHGGFETFAAKLAPWLVERGWDVGVYCQLEPGSISYEDVWCGVRRINIPSKRYGPLGTIEFDLLATQHVLSQPGIDLVLGYNTAIFTVLQRLKRRKIVINMDGIEWKRQKWGIPAKLWFIFNEICGLHLGTVTIADHPEIKKHLARLGRGDSVMIPYGSDRIINTDESALQKIGVCADEYFVSIARIEPENSILEIVQGFCTKPRPEYLVILGNFEPDRVQYHARISEAANDHVLFAGAIYDQELLKAIRGHARAYCHGHQVGGTNPSLVEALGAGSAVIAHDNKFNRWTAGDEQTYFTNVSECSSAFDVMQKSSELLIKARVSALTRHESKFQWIEILKAYESVFNGLLT
jgi:glycosyltransferase involved in cell wall biosynthesis